MKENKKIKIAIISIILIIMTLTISLIVFKRPAEENKEPATETTIELVESEKETKTIVTETESETKTNEELTTEEKIEETKQQIATTKPSRSSSSFNNSSNKTEVKETTTKKPTTTTTKPVTTTEKTTTYDSYYDASRYSVGYVTFSDPRGTSEDSAYWTTCIREFTWCEDSQGSCDDCYIQKEIYGFEGNGMWHPYNTLVISPSAENINKINEVVKNQKPSFDGEYEGQTYKLKFWVWDPC